MLGLLDKHLLDTDHTLTEARILFELGRANRGLERLELRDKLEIDQSFLGRVLSGLQRAGLVTVARDSRDGRRHHLTLTAAGRAAYRELDKRSARQIEALLDPITDDQRRSLVEAMAVIAAVVRPGTLDRANVMLRSLEPGDLGLGRSAATVRSTRTSSRGTPDFEGLVAQIVADYHAHHRPGRDNAWIATVDGARAGCVFCVERDATTAQLRILLVEPWARGPGHRRSSCRRVHRVRPIEPATPR